MVGVSVKGSFDNTFNFFDRLKRREYLRVLDKYGQLGVDALRRATPKDTGKTSESWYYEVIDNKDTSEIVWYNSNVNKGVNIALILHYGHAAPDGSFVRGFDYINPAIKPTFDKLAVAVWSEVKNL